MAIENIQEIEKILRLKEGSLVEAITKEESVKIEIPTLEVFTPDEIKTRDSRTYGAGKDAEREMTIRDKAKELNLTVEKLTIDSLLEAHKELVKKELGASDNELQKTLIEKDNKIKSLLTVNSEYEAKLKDTESNYINKLNQIEINEKNINTLNSILGKNPAAKLNINKEDAVVLFNNIYSVKKTTEGLEVFKGEIRLENDKTFNPIPLDEVWDSFLKEKNLIKVEGGSGDGNEGRSNKRTMDAFIKEMESKGINPNSEKFSNELNKRVSNKEIDL